MFSSFFCNFIIEIRIFQYFKTVLINEDTGSLHLHAKIYNVFDELCRISESIVEDLIPTIEHRLTVKEFFEFYFFLLI